LFIGQKLYPGPTLHSLYATGKSYLRLLSYIVLLFLEKVFIICFLVAMESSFSPYAILPFLEETIITCFPVVGGSSLFYLAGFSFFLLPVY
jgi:hypothetical protein